MEAAARDVHRASSDQIYKANVCFFILLDQEAAGRVTAGHSECERRNKRRKGALNGLPRHTTMCQSREQVDGSDPVCGRGLMRAKGAAAHRSLVSTALII